MKLTAVSTLLLLGAALEPLSVLGLSFPDVCSPSSCLRAPSKCAYGKVKDACNCCDFCGNGPGEHCGGEFNILGMCGKGMECVSNNVNEPTTFPEGLCVWKMRTAFQPGKKQQQQPAKLQTPPPGLKFVPQKQQWLRSKAWRKFSANQPQREGKVAKKGQQTSFN
ncbi:venom protein 302-like [Cloeon dipterum]|uniref:venom protein 302-like n=1 Tax=Cloeon dipterum TaxID=197152 RepID=UPI0032205E63